MTCSEAREYLFAFLDSELDAPLSIQVQRHLDGCPTCACEAEIERTVTKRLEHVLRCDFTDVPVFEHAVRLVVDIDEIVMQERSANRISFGWRRPLAVVAAVAAFAGVGVWSLLRDDEPGRGPSTFADLVVGDFEHFMDEGQEVQLASADNHHLADWLFEKTSVHLTVPATVDGGHRLLGGRKCKLAGEPAAFAVYELKGAASSLVAFADKGIRFDGMEEIRYLGRSLHVAHCRGHTVVALRHRGLVYAAVSAGSEEELFGLLTGVINESD